VAGAGGLIFGEKAPITYKKKVGGFEIRFFGLASFNGARNDDSGCSLVWPLSIFPQLGALGEGEHAKININVMTNGYGPWTRAC
jgi:hypothetical protein